MKRNRDMLKVQEPGFFTSVQDRGRTGYRHMGIPEAGTSDRVAADRANLLLENPPEAAVLEIAMKGPVAVFEAETYMALCGAELEAELNGAPLSMGQVYRVPAESVLRCGHMLQGLRSYLAVKGGFQTPLVFGSRSYFFPVTPQRQVKSGQAIPYAATRDFEPKLLKINAEEFWKVEKLPVYPGPEFEWLTPEQKHQLFSQRFTLDKEYDRMACQLQQALPGHALQMITSATLPGTVQLTPSGRLIALLRDGQTTGGYPRILQLPERAISVLAQKHVGDTIRFQASAGI